MKPAELTMQAEKGRSPSGPLGRTRRLHPQHIPSPTWPTSSCALLLSDSSSPPCGYLTFFISSQTARGCHLHLDVCRLLELNCLKQASLYSPSPT